MMPKFKVTVEICGTIEDMQVRESVAVDVEADDAVKAQLDALDVLSRKPAFRGISYYRVVKWEDA